MESTTAPEMIEARQVTEAQFRALLGRHFEVFGATLDFPREVLEHLRIFATDYQEGDWRYYELSNEGFYAAPDWPRLQVRMNQTAEMSADAAGIATALFVLEGLGVLDPRLSRHHQHLQTYADQHAEAELIRFVAAAPATANDILSEEKFLSGNVPQEDSVTIRSHSPDVVVISSAGSTGISLHAPDPSDTRSQELDTLRQHLETWLDTAAVNRQFASGERMLVLDKHERALTQVTEDGAPRTTLEWPKPNLAGVLPLAHQNAQTVQVWLETERPEYAPYRVCDFEAFARTQANRVDGVIRGWTMMSMRNDSRLVKSEHAIKMVQPDTRIVYLTAPPLALIEPEMEPDDGGDGTSPCP
ncbi:MAG: hypothetical protein JWL65_3324 [Gammaproteobacteria bacterium]|nr:hypothetical protein [Gammaproteobacteria bacterium]